MTRLPTENLIKALNTTDLTDYQSIPFWSWNNEIEPEELVRQIEDMKSVGIGGFIMHARIGLKTEYLGEKWFACVDACLKKARELHMNAWVYDENGWPSGFVGGKLLEVEDYRAQFLEYAIKESFDAEAFCVYRLDDEKGFVRIGADEQADAYHCVYLRTSPANTDILNPAVMEAFIRETHDEYYKRFPDSFGRELIGFFTDEPQCYRAKTSYSRFIRDAYMKEFGEDVCDSLAYLFTHDERGYQFRERYYTIMARLYTETFYKTLYDWCEAHNCKLTGHSIQETPLSGAMTGGGNCSSTYAYEQIPGIDWLGRECGTEQMPRQIGSVASQLGIKQILTETFACCGYDVTPKELKSVGEFQFFHGVNLLCQHLYPYSLAAQGKTDHPPVFSPQGNWFKQFKDFNDYFTKLGFLMANTKDKYDLLLIHPLRSVYLDYVKSEGKNSVAELEESFKELLADFRKKGIIYHFADEYILEKFGKSEGDTFTVGQCEYKTVIVPEMKTISAHTLSLLENYKGKLLLLGKPEYVNGKKADVSLRSNITLADVQANTTVKFSCEDGKTGITARASELGDYLFIKNYSRTESSTFRTEGVADSYKALDLETFALSDIDNEMTLDACESLILIKDETAKARKTEFVSEDITDRFAVTGITENYLVMDNAAISYDSKTFTEVLPLQRHFEDLLRADYKGKLWVRQTFRVTEKMPLTMMFEAGKYLTVTLNGKSLDLVQSKFDVYYVEADVTDAVIEGENVFEYSIDYYQHEGVHFALFDPLATESLRNCLYYDTHIENVFVKGDFTVSADHVISPRTALPAMSSELYKNGYPFFKGTLTLKGECDYDGKGRRIISFGGRFLVGEIEINGKVVNLSMDFKKDITDYLKVGRNEMTVKLNSSLRNLFGPHHYAPIPEPMGVSPMHFTRRGEWKGGIAEKFTPVYNSVPFGVDKVEILKEV
ncbi:MAG: hypothetical protein IJW16_01140 [Clostridia bacterium]|nr:hypothetical protein [Clostridia bacterium]